jgi:threonine synthase
MENNGIIKRYFEYLPVDETTPIISLNEGNTPLIEAKNIQKKFLGDRIKLFLKYEGSNPTGSFKDRGMTVAISKALQKGNQMVICASTGNTAASAAAYAARAGMKCVVVIPEGKIAFGKLTQAIIHNAFILQIKGNFDQALALVRYITKTYLIALVNSLNPDRIEGQKTAAFEVCDVLGQAPDYHILPVGNAGNITAYWKGYKEYKKLNKIKNLPKMIGIQAAGACPIVKGKKIDNPQTIATAIRIGNPASWQGALQAKQESGGIIDTVEDNQIVDAMKLLAEYEGIFVEPASAASIAGLIKLKKQNFFHDTKSKVVATLTGCGLKDPEFVKEFFSPNLITTEAEINAVVEALLTLNNLQRVG